MDVNIRIAGEAGQGVQTTGGLLVDALASVGVYVFSTQSYMSRVRGGLNSYDVRIADRELHSGAVRADLLVALTPEALEAFRPQVAGDGVILFDGEAGGDGVLALGFSSTAREISGSELLANTVAAGAVFALLGYDLDALCSMLEDRFHKKGEDLVRQNIECARRGAELAAGAGVSLVAPALAGAPATVASGTEATGLAAATSGVGLVASYPMTPSTGVFTFLAGVADEYGILVEQAEDEIAAINMVCGATYAGVPAMTTTSGGGFALMAEGLSLAGMLELPAVIMLSQRPGPATGLPTRTGQEDLKFAVSAGHGEFPRAVFAPGSPEQCFELTRLAFETAHRWQTPVILMLDQFLADLQKNVPPMETDRRPIDRRVVTGSGADYARYAPADDGVSPRAVPGGDAIVVVDSDEHTEDGHITEDLDARVRLTDKRLRKADGLRSEVLPPEPYGEPGAGHVLVCWGSTRGPCREAVDILSAGGESVSMLHFPQTWPIDAEAVRSGLSSAEKITSVEGNARGQFASLLREAGALGQMECGLVTRYDGLPFTGEYIAGRIRG